MRVSNYSFPENHPLKKQLRALTWEALGQSSLRDNEICSYVSDLLVDFMSIENFYAIRDANGRRLEYISDLLEQAKAAPPGQRHLHYQQIGDHLMFLLGMFPESLTYGRRMRSHSHCADEGRRSYIIASEMSPRLESTVTFRKLAEKFERCVLSVNWVREYTTDKFYQYMHRQFGVGV